MTTDRKDKRDRKDHEGRRKDKKEEGTKEGLKKDEGGIGEIKGTGIRSDS